MAGFHTNPSNLRIVFLQVENCELPKNFSGPPIGDRDLARQFTEEGWSGACCALQNFEVKRVNLLCKW